jgi:hypothetical protein
MSWARTRIGDLPGKMQLVRKVDSRYSLQARTVRLCIGKVDNGITAACYVAACV